MLTEADVGPRYKRPSEAIKEVRKNENFRNGMGILSGVSYLITSVIVLSGGVYAAIPTAIGGTYALYKGLKWHFYARNLKKMLNPGNQETLDKHF